MKVGICLPQSLPEVGGGYTFESEMIRWLIAYVSQSEHQFYIYVNTKNNSGNLTDLQIKADNVKVIHCSLNLLDDIKSKIYRRIKALKQRVFNPSNYRRIEGWFEQYISNSIKQGSIDIIWSFQPSLPVYEIPDIPYVVTLWDLEHRAKPYFPELVAQGEWEHREKHYTKLLKRATYIITGTEVGKSKIEHFYQIEPERVKVLPFSTPSFAMKALENENKDKEVLQKYNLSPNYLFYPAQFWSHKNHIALLLAVALLRDQYHLTLSVVFVGSDKGNEAYIKSWTDKLNLSEQVHFLGFVPQEDLPSLYRQAFALTFMSLCGPDNLPPLEAFALSCPVIATKIPGAVEQLGDAALLIDTTNEQEIAEAIKTLLNNKSLRNKLIENGQQKVLGWTGKDYIAKMFLILDEFAKIRRCWDKI